MIDCELCYVRIAVNYRALNRLYPRLSTHPLVMRCWYSAVYIMYDTTAFSFITTQSSASLCTQSPADGSVIFCVHSLLLIGLLSQVYMLQASSEGVSRSHLTANVRLEETVKSPLPPDDAVLRADSTSVWLSVCKSTVSI